jgi:hypothetical protein
VQRVGFPIAEIRFVSDRPRRGGRFWRRARASAIYSYLSRRRIGATAIYSSLPLGHPRAAPCFPSAWAKRLPSPIAPALPRRGCNHGGGTNLLAQAATSSPPPRRLLPCTTAPPRLLLPCAHGGRTAGPRRRGVWHSSRASPTNSAQIDEQNDGVPPAGRRCG